jgi:hypothetical protein
MYLFLCIPIRKFNGLDVFIEFFINSNSFVNRFPSSKGPITGHILYNRKKDADEIFVNFKYLFLSKIAKQFLLWHEYAHHALGDTIFHFCEEGDIDYLKSTYYTREAMADFFACCKLKINFRNYLNINKSLNKITGVEDYKEETDYNKWNKQFEEKKMNNKLLTKQDFVYTFYQNPHKMIEKYNVNFKQLLKTPKFEKIQEIKKLYSEQLLTKDEYMSYKRDTRDIRPKRYDWIALLKECGWDNKTKRIRYFN